MPKSKRHLKRRLKYNPKRDKNFVHDHSGVGWDGKGGTIKKIAGETRYYNVSGKRIK